ncbi:hypothetical protein D3C78_1231320 [compost metagenome]
MTVGINGVWPAVSSEWNTGSRFLAIHLDRADEDETLDPCRCGLSGKIEGSVDIDRTELGNGIGQLLAHHMHPGGGMDDHVHLSQRICPVLKRA